MRFSPGVGGPNIGGTKVRFALADLETIKLSEIRTCPSRGFASLPAALAAYVPRLPALPPVACLAVAGSVSEQAVQLTNNG
jgi:glucokinase